MARLRIYDNGVVEDGASTYRFGTRELPAQEVTVTGKPNGEPDKRTVAAGASVTLWTYHAASAVTGEPWEVFRLRILTAAGYGVLSTLVAKPTGVADFTPLLPAAGPDWRWRHRDVSSIAPEYVSSDNSYMSDNDAIATDDSGNVTEAGYAASFQALLDGAQPKLWDGTHVPIQGRIYKLVFRNVGATPIDIEFGRVN